jgi:hypothetical protein
MLCPRVASPAAKILISLALVAPSQIAGGAAAPRCPSGQILRVSLGTCVPKAENLAILAKYGTKKGKPANTEGEPSPPAAAKPDRGEAAKPDRPDEQRIEVARHDAPAPVEQPASPPEASSVSQLLSPFGALFVGAFRSTLSTGLSGSK